jgi:hypothetical protein
VEQSETAAKEMPRLPAVLLHDKGRFFDRPLFMLSGSRIAFDDRAFRQED